MTGITARAPRVVVLSLMYRHAEQAIECLSSVMASNYPNFRIIMLDNASPDGAYESVRAWARGAAPPGIGPNPLGVTQLHSGPIDHAEMAPGANVTEIGPLPLLTLVQTGANLGYAGGNNVALKWLQASRDWDYAWILNPDTAVDPQAMAALVTRCVREPRLGPVGARICSYDQPDLIQQRAGGHHKLWRGTGGLIGLGQSVNQPVDIATVEHRLDYVSGASFFLPRAFLDRAGLMDECYFLYFEEVDWCRRRGDMRLGYAHDALVYHRLGGSIGSSTSLRQLSSLSARWLYRNRFLFTRKFYPWALPVVYLTTYLDVVRMIKRGAWRNAWLVFKVMNGLERVAKPQH